LNKLVWAALAIALVLYFPGDFVAGSYAANIINGKTPEDADDKMCSEADLLDYVDKAKKDIGNKWQPVKGFEDRNVVVMFSVRQNGKIEDAKILEGSGSQAVDQTALEALKAASPLKPLPKEAPEPIQIRYVFSWHVTRK
jgi:TonB family protein